MKRSFWALSSAMLAIACSSNPTGPSAAPSAARPAAQEGVAGTAAITTERIRLRLVNGPDIVTTLVTGQIIEVPVNVNLDIWAEIRRLESDSARLTVNFGNGNQPFTGCGSCRLENVYKQVGTYTLTARVIDLNAPTDTSVIVAATVTIKVVDPNAVTTVPLVCSGVSENFNAQPILKALPISVTGAAFTASSPANSTLSRINLVLGTFDFLGTRALSPQGDLTITFTDDKNFATISVAGLFTTLVSQEVTIQAFDAAGTLVASSSRTPTNTGGIANTWREDVMTVSNVVFRKLVISSDHVIPGTFLVDNLNATCR